MIQSFIRLFCLTFLLSMFACIGDKGKNIPDVSHIEIDLSLKQFERELLAMDTSNLEAGK
jgi:hypothetical protein